jgi:alpha-beta hydrolase superfamily lysophospholipase
LMSGYDNIELVTIEGSRHEIYRESDIYRDQLWQKIDQFLGVK